MCLPDCKSTHAAWVHPKSVYITLDEQSVLPQF